MLPTVYCRYENWITTKGRTRGIGQISEPQLGWNGSAQHVQAYQAEIIAASRHFQISKDILERVYWVGK